MAEIDADLMREARELFAKFQAADATNAGRFWKQVAADAPKLKKGRPPGPARPQADRQLLFYHDLVARGMPELKRGRVSAVARFWADSQYLIIQDTAAAKKLQRLLDGRGEERFTQEEQDHITLVALYFQGERAKARGEPLRPLDAREIEAFTRFVARTIKAESANVAAVEGKRREEMAEILKNPDRYPFTKPD